MKVKKALLGLKTDFTGTVKPKKFAGGELPLRSELYSADQMEQHGLKLAYSHKLELHHGIDFYLLARLAENEEVLLKVYNLITQAAKSKRQISPAGEWLLDNYYLIEEQIRTGKRHLPKGYSKELPSLLNGISKGLPRVYDIALEIISHSDGRVDPESLSRFITAYQTVNILKLGELWAIPIMLRLGLIENLRRVASLVALSRIDRDLANSWADRMMKTAETLPKNLILVFADMVRSSPPLTPAFVSEFARRLQGQSPALALPLTWIEQQLADSGLTIERLVQLGNQQQASEQLSISNSIDSLRFLSAMDWKEFVETMSVVEKVFRHDPLGSYGRMDFLTRDRYRHTVERIARNSSLSEDEVAQLAINMAQKSADRKIENNRRAHVGYYLVDKGLPKLERRAKVRFSFAGSISKIYKKFGLLFYIGFIFLLTFLFTEILIFKAFHDGIHGWTLGFMGLLLFICTSFLSFAIANWLETILTVPKPLPRMNFINGIPPESRTLVVIPTILMNIQFIENLAEALEVRFLANQDKNLHFGLLTDLKDSKEETLSEDESLIEFASRKIESLNEKYPGTDSDTFFLFHRPRRWNPAQKLWMGYERKRGKLTQLNSLLRGSSTEHFSHIIGKTNILSNIKYVITLDTDTLLPRDSARQFIGTMAHPLNRAIYDEKKHRVVEGYGILQPRVAVSIPGSNLSRYAKLYASDPGIDPYTRAVSDVYQDVFGEGSFIGKGIYDVDIFKQAFNGNLPENKILSHDLLEGCYARSGLLSDVQLFEEYPSGYLTDVKRRHRWIRGDWQIIQWLFPFVRGSDSRLYRNPLSTLSRWKILDNLRRSIIPLSLLILLILGWTVLLNPYFWTLTVLGIVFFPTMIISIFDLFRKQTDVLPRQHLISTIRSSAYNFGQAAFSIISLPYEAFYSTDAILRTLWRTFITNRNLLEWNISSSHDSKQHTGIFETIIRMWIAPVFAIILLCVLIIFWHSSLIIALPVICLWIASPLIAFWIGLIPSSHVEKLSSSQLLFLRELSRKTWAFFETFVTSQDHWLPPDNFQEFPAPVIAHRTSPTNIGLSLLSNLAAYDFGYISLGYLIERTSNTFLTMHSLERYQGHFYNWYDTLSLKPMRPLYISSVDSGNLAGHLLILKNGLIELPDNKIINPSVFDAIGDTLKILTDIAEGDASVKINQFRKDLKFAINAQPVSLLSLQVDLDLLAKSAEKIFDYFKIKPGSLAFYWSNALIIQCRRALDDLEFLTPWILIPSFSELLIKFPEIGNIPTLRELAKIDIDFLPFFESLPFSDAQPELSASHDEFHNAIRIAAERATNRIYEIESLALQSGDFASFNYDFLYNKGRHLLSIGYNVDDRQKDSSYYDLLASEARFSSFVAIAQGKVSQESWFALGRLLTATGGNPVLLSWGGSMFEYLMPLLVMPTYENTLLDQTYKTAVQRQIEYGKIRSIPWGLSESGYNLVDVHMNYQYKAFGVPGMGLKRGLSEDIVVAPYATMLSLMVSPEKAYQNLERLIEEKMLGKFGFYEAIDYTQSRLSRGQTGAIIQSYMAHHAGMSFLSLAYLILDKPMQKRFNSDPMFKSAVLLLQERIPKNTEFYSNKQSVLDIHTTSASPDMPVRVITRPDTLVPEVHLLSNGRYQVMITNAGGGYSRWKNIDVTRWREDSTCDNWGIFCYINNVESGEIWSTAYQPTLKLPENYEAIFSKGRAEFRRRDNDFDTHTEIVVSPEDDIELRRIRITNRSRKPKAIVITSYAEVVLTTSAADAIHPAFSNLFVQTEIINERQAILCTRRPRSEEEKVPWMFHLMTMHEAEKGEISYETDRMKFIGRGKSIISPEAMQNSNALSGTQGSVLDPIVSIRYHINLEPEQSAKIDIVTGISETREKALSLIEKYQDRRLTNRVFELAWTHSQVVLRQINATEADAQLYGRLAGFIIYANSSLRANQGTLIKNRRGQSGLWGYSISGDLPIVLLKIEDPANLKLVRQLVQAHTYWRLKGLAVDLVIWNEDHAGYRQLLQDQIIGLISAGMETNFMDQPGGIFVRVAEQISIEDRILIQTVARVIITDKKGSLAEQINRRSIMEVSVPFIKPARSPNIMAPEVAQPRNDLTYFNGLGGFTKDGREYIITTSDKIVTPAPWVNVIANKNFGTVISENGIGYTWSENAHEFRLTPWHNDPVSDAGGEVFYIRDEETGYYWSPTSLPCCGVNPYISRHGFGYSVFEHIEDGINTELWVYIGIDASIKFSVLKIKNVSDKYRNLTVTGYVEWVLGDILHKSKMHIVTEIDSETGAIFVRNSYNTEFPGRVAFFQTDEMYPSISCDRTEFLGRNGTLRNPVAMTRARLSGKFGAGLDPCSAIQVPLELAIGQEREIIFKLGVGRDSGDARKLVARFRGPAIARSTLEDVWQFWKETLGKIQVETPDESLNILTNGWLMYQTIACRLWARSGYYQSGGAFGFRDQLQDVMALIHTSPLLLREHILLCASRQFKEGDVQHWWHPPSGRGVRTHCSDDYLWLPYATCRYVMVTGDTGILDEKVNFLEGRPVNPEDDSYYDLPNRSEEIDSIYQHCVRAIQKGLNFGSHGLPLIGSGDWNDGMNMVGNLGKGESVWLGFFLYEVLTLFTNLAKITGDLTFFERCINEANILRSNIEKNAWDGKWYLRAWFDDGSPIGSSNSPECQIDSIAQSWSVLSGAGDANRSKMAMESLENRLVKHEDKLVQLLDPPFDKSNLNPGYIKGYVPGVRENGGQYTHAAIWATMAFAKLGDKKHAWELMTMINPINHARDPEMTAIYKVEPYVVAADVYALSPHIGRGGWTWYTGSAGWMYRLITESLLGLNLDINKLYIKPCIPPEWKSFKLHYRYRQTVYHITIIQLHHDNGEIQVTVDGVEQSDIGILLVDDNIEHAIEVKI